MEALLELERALIGFDTVSANSNLELIDYVASRLGRLGLTLEHYPSPDGRKANLFATLGPRDEPGGLMFSGHTDVVPVEGQAWDSDPFALVEREGRFYGRGTADMKSFIAQCMLAAETLKDRRLRRPLHLAFTYDEEVGCDGAAVMVHALREAGRALPAWAVIGEPTNFEVFRMHKGQAQVRVTVRGVEGHSSKPDKGANAIYPAARVVSRVEEVGAERKGHRSMEADFEVPYTTVSVGVMRAGTAFNIIPNHAEVLFEYRTMPEENPDYVLQQVQGYVQEVLLPEFRRRQPGTDIRVERTYSGAPMMTPAGSDLERAALELTGHDRARAAPYYTEGAVYNEAGITTIICGPGDIDQAHRPNEYITREQLEQGVPLLTRLAERLCL